MIRNQSVSWMSMFLNLAAQPFSILFQIESQLKVPRLIDMNMIPGWTDDAYGYDAPNIPYNRIHEMVLPDSLFVKTRVDYEIHYDIKICGLYHGSHGRSCHKHMNCGQEVVVGNILRLRYVSVPVLFGLLQRRIAAVLLDEEGADTCTVGFLSPRLYDDNYLHRYVGTTIQVASLGSEAPEIRELQDDQLFGGFADCVLLATIKPNDRDLIPVVYNN
jgi:hypothetical protein